MNKKAIILLIVGCFVVILALSSIQQSHQSQQYQLYSCNCSGEERVFLIQSSESKIAQSYFYMSHGECFNVCAPNGYCVYCCLPNCTFIDTIEPVNVSNLTFEDVRKNEKEILQTR